MKNRKYEEPKLELVEFSDVDILTASASDPFAGEDDSLIFNK